MYTGSLMDRSEDGGVGGRALEDGEVTAEGLR